MDGSPVPPLPGVGSGEGLSPIGRSSNDPSVSQGSVPPPERNRRVSVSLSRSGAQSVPTRRTSTLVSGGSAPLYESCPPISPE